MSRRDVLKVMGASLPILETLQGQTPATGQTPAPRAGPRGGPWDPDLLHPKADWPRKLTAAELVTLAALCDTILPADGKSPSASAVGVPAWINQSVSNPNDVQQRDLIRVRGGLAWLNLESRKRFGKSFKQAGPAEREQICDDICYLPKAKPAFQSAARCFDLVRDLSASGFYTTVEGMRDVGYIGNVALPKFPEVSDDIKRKLGL